MNYFVVMPDGQKYGPATVDVLTQWASEGRLTQNTMLEQEGTGQQIMAGHVAGILWPGGVADASMPPAAPNPYATGYQQPMQNPYSQAPGYTPYQRQGVIPGDDGSKEMTWAWVCGGLGLVCCGVIAPIVGIVMASTAQKKGHPSANAAKIFNIVVLVLGIIGTGFFVSSGRW